MSHAFETATELARRIREKEISSRELTDDYIRRIEKYDDVLNAVVVRDFDRALEAADAADAALARGQTLGPLHGVPMTIKEAYDIEGLPTTWGVPQFEKNVASSDAETVKRFKAAGAHFMGKTNVPLAARGLPELQRDLRYDEQPVEPRARPRRLIGRFGGRAGRRARRPRERLRHRWVDTQSRPLLRRLRSQAHLGHRSGSGPRASRDGGLSRHRRGRADGAQRR